VVVVVVAVVLVVWWLWFGGGDDDEADHGAPRRARQDRKRQDKCTELTTTHAPNYH
jgi:hypothetical protein